MTPPLLIRAALPEDDLPLGELLVSSFLTTYARKMPEVVVTERRKEELRAVAEKRRAALVWVAQREGLLEGTVALWAPGAAGSQAFLPDAADLRHLAVRPGLGGKGVAGALMETAEAAAWALGAQAICLHVRRGAHGIARMYQARGYLRRIEGDLDLLPEIFLEGHALLRPASSQRQVERTALAQRPSRQ